MVEKLSIDEDVVVEKFSAHNFSFPKNKRLLKRREYAYLFRNRKRLIGKYICIDYAFVDQKNCRMGLTVSTRYGKSHERNRFKRCVREAFRLLFPLLPQELQINIIPRHRAKFVSSCEIQEEMHQLIKEIC